MATPKGITNPYGKPTGAAPKLTPAKPKTVAQPWNTEQVANESTYVDKKQIRPEDREYLEGFMNRYYPNQGANEAAQAHYARSLEEKQMEQQGFKKDPKFGYNGPNGEWTSGPSFKDSAYWNSRQQFVADRKNTLLNEIKRKYPDWPADYQEHVADDVFSKWYWNAADNYEPDNKESTQNIAAGVQGVM